MENGDPQHPFARRKTVAAALALAVAILWVVVYTTGGSGNVVGEGESRSLHPFPESDVMAVPGR